MQKSGEMMPSCFREEAMSVLRYNPEDGHFYWTDSRSRHAKFGARAGGQSNHGYIRICLFRRKIMAHRLAWLFQTGSWPPSGLMVDHINRNRSDNRWDNLRLCSPTGNSCNASKRRDNSSGESGVSFQKASGKWRSYIRMDGRQIHIGLFETAEEAISARRRAAETHYGEYSPTRRA